MKHQYSNLQNNAKCMEPRPITTFEKNVSILKLVYKMNCPEGVNLDLLKPAQLYIECAALLLIRVKIIKRLIRYFLKKVSDRVGLTEKTLSRNPAEGD